VRILVTEPAARASGRRIKGVDPSVELVVLRPDRTLALEDGPAVTPEDAGIEVAWATSDLYEDSDLLRPFFGLVRRLEGLKWFQSQAAGFEAPVFAELIRRGVLFTKSDAHSVPIAEFVLRAVLDHFQQPERWRAAQADRRWARHEFKELSGTTWVVVGLGSIGLEVARLAAAFGVAVIGVRRHPRGDEPVAETVTPDALSSVLGRAEVVVLCAPANASTRHLVDDAFLAAMAPGSLLVNIGRGSVVDEAALLRALDGGGLAGAVLDVFETEPLPEDSPLWAHPKVAVTPHNSAIAGARYRRQEDLFVANLGRFVRGEPLSGVVTEHDLD
jgi:phosphoglycerate dehydrogenase-like enzyme